MDPIEITFKDGFRLWYVCDCTGPAIIVSEPNRVPTRDQEHKIWIVKLDIKIIFRKILLIR